MAKSNALKMKLPSVDDLFSTEESRKEAKLTKIYDIPISEIDDFPDHPYLVWNGDYYYMIGYSDKHGEIGSFRVDRISRQPKILSENAVPAPEDFNLNDYINTSFRMYSTKRQKVELICDNSVMDAIIDKFGEDVQTYAYDLKSFKAEVNIAVSHVFFSWVFGFGGRVKIHSPKEVKSEYAEIVKQAYENI